MPPTPTSEFVGIVVAAGRSQRFGGTTPKQFLDLGGRSVLDRAIDSLSASPSVGGVVVVLPPDETEGSWAAALRRRRDVVAVVAGGATRAESVRLGLRAVGGVEFVLVHDAARPLAAPALVRAVVDATVAHGAAIPALGVTDTVKRVADPVPGESGEWVRGTLDRDRLCLAQTPQGARRIWLEQALQQAASEGRTVTDEASALEGAGRRVAIVAGDPENRKITSLDDLDQARRRFDSGLRVGTGFDIHRFGKGRRLYLGGVEFPGEPGLEGHSDADVVLHAAMDAVLGAAGMDDIGALFPPDDPRYEGAKSTDLARDVARHVASRGHEVLNLDLTVLAERPKIRARVEAMRRSIAQALGIRPERVGLKATTLEGLGAIGRGEGIACQAVVLLRHAGGT